MVCLGLCDCRNVAILKGDITHAPFKLQLLNKELPHKRMGAKLQARALPAAGIEGHEAMDEMGADENYQPAQAKPVKRPQKKAKAAAA